MLMGYKSKKTHIRIPRKIPATCWVSLGLKFIRTLYLLTSGCTSLAFTPCLQPFMSNGKQTIPVAADSVATVPVSAEAYLANAQLLHHYREGFNALQNANEAGYQLWLEERNRIVEAARVAAQEEEAARQRRKEAE
jgi:hypothetical protein